MCSIGYFLTSIGDEDSKAWPDKDSLFNTFLLLVLFPFLHDDVDNLGEPLHFFCSFKAQTMWVDTTPNIDRYGEPPGQNFRYARCVLDARR